MKNKKIYITMTILSITFLLTMYILKIWFPEQFVIIINNEKLIKIGNYIDNNKLLYYICCSATSFLTYFLYCCACCHKLYLKWYEYLFIITTIIIVRVLSLFDLTLSTALQFSSFIFLPAIMKGDLKSCAIVNTVHLLSQAFSLGIRGLPIYLDNTNFMTGLILTFDMYLWLLFMYILFNFKKEN